MKITREQMEVWAETYSEAIDTLLWVVNDDYTKAELLEAIAMSEEESDDAEKS